MSNSNSFCDMLDSPTACHKHNSLMGYQHAYTVYTEGPRFNSTLKHFLNQVRMPGFLKLPWSACWYTCVCVSVCPPPRALITSGVIWCDIGRVRLVKQALRLFPTFNYFIRHLPSIKWMGVAILTEHVVNACQIKLR